MLRILAAATPLVLLALPSMAQPANLKPTRDVTVDYKMSGMAGVPPQEMTMAFAPASGKQRVDTGGGMGWMLIDRKANTAVMVMDAQRATMAMPPATVAAMTQDVPPGATFTKKGTATVAGTGCTEWELVMAQGKGTSCITDDGVLLRAVTTAPNGATVTMEATKVTYAPVDAAKLAVPAGYTAMSMPGGAPGGVSGGVPGGVPGGMPGAAPSR